MKSKGNYTKGLISRCTNYKESDIIFTLLSEEKGIQKFLANEANGQIKIPIDSRLESLNVSNATSVILFEAKRQRI